MRLKRIRPVVHGYGVRIKYRRNLTTMRIAVILLLGWNLYAMNYSTTFPAAENPISQGKLWSNGKASG